LTWSTPPIRFAFLVSRLVHSNISYPLSVIDTLPITVLMGNACSPSPSAPLSR
jgi:hypothetical protein